jgi:hypothetical protein
MPIRSESAFHAAKINIFFLGMTKMIKKVVERFGGNKKVPC